MSMMTKYVAAFVMLLAARAGADPLGLIDYEQLFAENADAVEAADADRDLLQVGDIVILRGNEDDVTFMGLDQSGHGAVGCFVSVLASLESALLACEVTLPAEQQAISDDYRARALAFYAENAFPPADPAEVMRRYDALVASEIDLARPFCSDPSVVTDFSDRLFVADTNDEIDGMMSIPRLPVANPCL
ncbi:hypothetical protein SLH49_18910 [Cognatiyoonia sp. IB215446]|uniref:hypothetical protein n=1 Tax=Cognatiyoonia sp. IB215446 TaxID=3097355 RepID=UPI002A14CE17|nr:hypothetical protein [Cognatiyoonia sp. IB215446]MDX8350066.1 hypothetical protein [Cognatiyoonia sp. IB215446]